MSENIITEEVIAKAQAGNSEAIDLIIKEYKNLIFLNVKNYFLVGADEDDLLQEGAIGLLKAIHAYTKGKASFKTFATLCIRRQILTAVRSSNAQKNSALNAASGNNLENENGSEIYPKELYSNKKYNPEEIFLIQERKERLQNIICKILSPLEQEVIMMYIENHNYQEIAINLQYEPKSVDNALQRAKKKIENYFRKKGIDNYL